jgi:hypothetical protein
MPVSDDELRLRQDRLQVEAKEVLAELDRSGLFVDLGPPTMAGSYVSGLMVWRELDIMMLGGPHFSPHDVLRLLHTIITIPGVISFEYHDERGSRRPTEAIRDERYHLPITVQRGTTTWRIDLTVWLHDPHANITTWHESVRDTITDEQRLAVLRIKDVWHQRPEYPDHVSGVEVYNAVLNDGVRTPEQFGAWLESSAPAR